MRNALPLCRLFLFAATVPVAAIGCGGEYEQDDVVTTTDAITISTSATYTLVGVQSGKCVQIPSTGTAVQIATCSSSSTRQQWKAESMGSGFYRLRNVSSSLCMDVTGASTSNSAAIIHKACGSATSQQWSFTDVSSGVERITNRNSGKVLDVAGKKTADGTPVNQYTSTGATNQQFRMPTTAASGKVFSSCRFHFGTTDGKAKANPALIPQLDFFTPGWMGWSDTFDQGYVCTEGNPGGVLANQVPVVVAYVAAFYAKRHFGRCDCNVNTCGTNNDLCHFGSADILNNLTAIINIYKSYAQGYAACYGTTRPIIFEMEPDWYQYIGSSQTNPMTKAQAGTIMGQFVDAIKQYLPNARISMDISPWVGNNGADNGADWYSNFDMSKFTFINTSGGGTNAGTSVIRSSNNMTWAGVRQVTGKLILADTGYGANGVSAGHDPNWDIVANINARIANGVTSISQYNPSSNWATTISNIRGQLNPPLSCP